jgi:hypothetical protein
MKTLLLSLFLLTALALALFLLPEPKKSVPFSLPAITSHLPYHPEWETRPLDGAEEKEVMTALSQPYRYLGSGGQCYTFVSEDDQYVIKFFKQKAFAIPSWVNHFPLSMLKKRKLQKKEERRSRVFEAFKLSFHHLSSETEILYVHLNRTPTWNRMLAAADKNGDLHELPLDALEFVIQRKAELIPVRIDRLMKNNESDSAKEAIEQLLDLNANICRRGFYNRDPNMRANCGFIGSKAILIDVGRVVYRETLKKPAVFRRSLLKSTRHFRKYLAAHHPQLLPHFDNCVAKILATNHNE